MAGMADCSSSCDIQYENVECDDILVWRKRNDQGLHECEIHAPGEQENAKTWKLCTKNPGHPSFIPINNLSLKHLKGVQEKQDVLDMIKELSILTVRLQVSYVSSLRPKGYAFTNSARRGLPHTGSGWVYGIKEGHDPCPCHKCRVSPKPFYRWWTFYIFTACHVVYNAEEAQATTVDFFYDDENSKTDGNIQRLHGLGVQDNNASDDVCLVECATHEVFLYEKITISMRRFEWLKESLDKVKLGSLCVVISHPHGMPKQVTIGEIKSSAKYDPEESMLVEHMYTYSADTCFGSSGAPVLSAVSSLSEEYKMDQPYKFTPVWPGAGPHSWGNVDHKLNQCGAGAFYTVAETNDVEMLQEYRNKNLVHDF